jgi:phosphoribosylformylglycinamidine synthase
MTPRVLILRAPGTNCDHETAFAFERAGGKADRIHINRLLEQPALARDYQILCIPGGFSYGDDLSAGRILGGQIRRNLGDAVHEFRDAGKLLLGICNGFQVLMRTGILLAEDASGPAATLALNASGKFEDRWVKLGVSSSKCVLLAGIQRMELPVAHAEGQFITRDEATLQALDAAGQLVLRYLPLGESEEGPVPYPDNPNGAMGNVAGVCDSTGRVLGLMPHPERHIDPTHHPRWTRHERREVGDGFRLFQNAIAYFR